MNTKLINPVINKIGRDHGIVPAPGIEHLPSVETVNQLHSVVTRFCILDIYNVFRALKKFVDRCIEKMRTVLMCVERKKNWRAQKNKKSLALIHLGLDQLVILLLVILTNCFLSCDISY